MSALATKITEITDRPIRKFNLLENAVLMRLSFSRFGTSRTVPMSQVTVDADKRRVKATKTIIDCQEAEDIQKLDRKFADWVKANCMPSMIEGGMYWVSLAKVEQMNRAYKDFMAERYIAIEVLCSVYEDKIEEDRKILAGIFNPADYPSVESVRNSYGCELSFISLVAPKSLQTVSEELYMQAKQKMENNIQEATEAMRAVLREQFSGLVNHLVDRLTPDPGGKKKKFHDTMTENFTQFLDSFSGRNLTEDGELAKLVTEARRLVGGVGPEVLRNQDTVREEVRRGFEQIKGKLDPMIGAEPIRRIEI